ncbi:uncharacterized protein LOC115219270 isoform X2 [Octopus sinensis]|uniref:Uncharacterized protein LOC115219270 isoform X2 n=1 Tax=Octopus sinensis TaxID=2607531 RepID=A0A7E6FAT9_9MOLL|nr:uncharacterized protein LOC115219270 isoform X2 [Octopus sinensis]
MDNTLLSPHRLVDLDLSDCDEHQVKGCDSSKENRKVEIFDVSSHLETTSNCESGFPNDKDFSVLEITRCVEQSPAKVVPTKKLRKKLMTKQNIPNILVDVISPQFKVNLKQKNTSIENNSFVKPDKDYEPKGAKSSSKPQKKGRVIPSRYMQSAQNFRTRTPTKKESKSGHNMTLTETNSVSSEELSVLSGNSNNNCNNQLERTAEKNPITVSLDSKRTKKWGRLSLSKRRLQTKTIFLYPIQMHPQLFKICQHGLKDLNSVVAEIFSKLPRTRKLYCHWRILK